MSSSATNPTASAVSDRTSGPIPLWRERAFLAVLAAAGMLALTAAFWWTPVADALTRLEFAIAAAMSPTRTNKRTCMAV